MMQGIEELRAAGALAPIDWHFARALTALVGDREPLVALAAALASHAVRQGHVCLDLHAAVARGVLVDDAGVPIACAWPPAERWLDALRRSALVDCAGDSRAGTPFVLDGRGRLYLRRYWSDQQRVATALRSRIDPAGDSAPAELSTCIARVFADTTHDTAGEPDWQRVAAAVAALQRVCIVSGGPGTGKTSTAVRMLAVLVEAARAAGRPLPRILLLAPTGKAAARLAEAVRAGKQRLPCSAGVRDVIPDDAATIHRGLGAVPGRSTRFRYHAGNRWLADVVLVDEASMIDLALMARIVEAMPAAARLILLGDQDQLASVDAGVVLGDVCNAGASRAFSRPFAARLGAILGTPLPSAPDAPPRPGMWDCVVELTQSYRYRTDSGIGALARAVRSGDAEAAAAVLRQGGDVALLEPGAEGELGAPLERIVREGFAPYLAASTPLARLEALSAFRVLCAHRRGPLGVERINAQIERLLASTGAIEPSGRWYDGRPILITENDYALRLFNGDIGVIAADETDPARHDAVFVDADGAPRRIAPSRLPPHETVFAMSIHKSQGSETDAVAVVLPEQPSPIVSRELLYTALTRARRRAFVCARPAVLAHAVAHRIERASGLRDALWES
jgi:exodeoxyribonuclease V alpha subunit